MLLNVGINIIKDVISNMVQLRRAVDGSYFVVVRRALVESQAWKEHDEMAFLAVGSPEVIPKQGDYLLRKIGSNQH